MGKVISEEAYASQSYTLPSRLKSQLTSKTCQRVCLPKRTVKMPTQIKQKSAYLKPK